MMPIDKEKLIKRFVSYVTIDTESDPESNTTPSTEKQWVLSFPFPENTTEWCKV